MPTLSIAEFAGNLQGSVPMVLHLPPLVERLVELTDCPEVLELNGATTLVRLLADAPCAVVSGNEVAQHSMRLAAGVPEVFGLVPGHKLSVLGLEAAPKHGTYVMNLGEMLQAATNGYLRATKHRVQSPPSGRERLSVAYFFHPRLDAVWKKCAELRIPANVHIADHPSCWQPLGPNQERTPDFQHFNQYGKDVLSYQELAPEAEIRPLGRISL